MLCVLILYISGGTYSLKSTPNDRFFEKLFMAILFTQNFCLKSAERKSLKKYFLYFFFWCLAWVSNKPTHNLLDYGSAISLMKYGNSLPKPAWHGGYIPISSSAKPNSVKRNNLIRTHGNIFRFRKIPLGSLFWTDYKRALKKIHSIHCRSIVNRFWLVHGRYICTHIQQVSI